MTKVKICGITNLIDAKLSIEFGADELGFNFYGKSPRYITPEAAKHIIERLPRKISKVGVFVNESIETVLDISSLAGLNSVQLHGDEDNEYLNELKMRSNKILIKALRVSPEFNAEEVVNYNSHAILLDGFSPNERGGTGDTFDWKIAKRVAALIPDLYLAGGLTPENVGDAIEIVKPAVVDVCSRIEMAPGQKDADKMRRFIEAVKETI